MFRVSRELSESDRDEWLSECGRADLFEGIETEVMESSGTRGLAHPALARSHAQSRGHFQAAERCAARIDRRVDFAPGNLFTPAHHGRGFGELRESGSWSSQFIEATSKAAELVQAFADRLGRLLCLGCRDRLAGRGDSESDQLAGQFRHDRSGDSGPVTGRPDARRAGLAPGIGRRDPATGQVGGRQLAAGQLGQPQAGHKSVADSESIDGDRLRAVVVGDPVAVAGSHDDSFESSVAFGSGDDVTGHQLDARLPDCSDVVESLFEHFAVGQQCGEFPEGVASAERIDDADHLHVHFVQCQRDDQQEGAGSGQQHATARCHALRLDQLLSGARGHHARQGPAGERGYVLVGSRSQDQVIGFENPETVGPADSQSPFGVDPNHIVTRQQRDPIGLLGQSSSEFIATVGLGGSDRGDGGVAIDLAAGSRVLVDDRDRQTSFGQSDRRRHPAGTGSDNHQSRVVTHDTAPRPLYCARPPFRRRPVPGTTGGWVVHRW